MANIPTDGHLYEYLIAAAPGDAYLITTPWPWHDSSGADDRH
jgi:hypothetical protein